MDARQPCSRTCLFSGFSWSELRSKRLRAYVNARHIVRKLIGLCCIKACTHWPYGLQMLSRRPARRLGLALLLLWYLSRGLRGDPAASRGFWAYQGCDSCGSLTTLAQTCVASFVNASIVEEIIFTRTAQWCAKARNPHNEEVTPAVPSRKCCRGWTARI
eukprot:798651-Amphidinium_carterae.2